jgi:hypothetical protein
MNAPAKAQLVPEVGPALKCMFNPAELTVMKSTKWDDDNPDGRNAPNLQFKSGSSATLDMSLFFDTTREERAVTEDTDKLLRFMETSVEVQDADEDRGRVRPPWLRFEWGAWKSQKMILAKVTLKFTYFKADGTPVRATADVKLKQFEDEARLPLQNPTSHTPYPTRIHHVTAGETLDRIAWRYFGDSGKWRLIADANNVANPLALEVGQPLVIPGRRSVRRA